MLLEGGQSNFVPSPSCPLRLAGHDRERAIKGEFLAHRNVHRSEDETANSIVFRPGRYALFLARAGAVLSNVLLCDI